MSKQNKKQAVPEKKQLVAPSAATKPKKMGWAEDHRVIRRLVEDPQVRLKQKMRPIRIQRWAKYTDGAVVSEVCKASFDGNPKNAHDEIGWYANAAHRILELLPAGTDVAAVIAAEKRAAKKDEKVKPKTLAAAEAM